MVMDFKPENQFISPMLVKDDFLGYTERELEKKMP